MQCLASRSVVGRSARLHTARKGVQNRHIAVCRAESETVQASTNSVPPASSSVPAPEWVPAQALPVLEFFNKDDFKFADSAVYKNYLEPYMSNEYVTMSLGWKKLPEAINGRLAMLGFLAGAGAEIFGAGSLIQQLGKSPQPVVFSLLLITAASIIPVVQGTKGNYFESLKDTVTLPEGVFTEPMEKIHGRIAMVGLAGLILIELFKGSALL